MIRLAKFLANSGIASRRDTERLIESGVITVNGKIIKTPVFFVDGSEEIKIEGLRFNVGGKSESKVFAFNKPINTITSTSDPSGRKTIYDAITSAINHQPSTLKYVGRLDYKTTGLLLLTNDGDLARKLTLPSSGLKRVYIANIHPKKLSDIKNPSAMRKFLSPTATDDFIFDSLRRGATIGKIKYAPMEIDVQSRYPLQIKITIAEGKKNEIRIAMDYIGFMVKKLHRVSYGPIELGNLPVGEIRELTKKEIEGLNNK